MSGESSPSSAVELGKQEDMIHRTQTQAVMPSSQLPPLPAAHSTLTPGISYATATSAHLSLRERIARFWYGLPTAAKLTLVLAVASTCLMVSYGIATVSLRSFDEEAHITTVIIIMALFTLYAVVDAVIYENALQLVSSIVIAVLMMARVIWFVATRPSTSTFLPLKIIWGGLIIGVQTAFILAALVACRQFGWRFYSKLGVDYRRKGASKVHRLGMLANLFNTLVKLDFAFLVTVSALGVDVAIEGRSEPDAPLLVVAATLFLGGATFLAVAIAVVGKEKWTRRLRLFDACVPLSFAAPIALIVVYHEDDGDIANAGTSVISGCCVLMVIQLALWIALHLVVSNREKMEFVAGRVTLLRGAAVTASGAAFGHPRSSQQKSSSEQDSSFDPVLAPLRQGAWLGKPAPRNPRKMRFFQISHDGSTLRWGWNKFVRLYYVQELLIDQDALTLTLTFLLDDELTLKFSDLATLEQWRRGLDRQMVALLAPDGSAEHASMLTWASSSVAASGSSITSAAAAANTKRNASRHNFSLSASNSNAIASTQVNGSSLAPDAEATAMEEGLLGMLGTKVRQLGKSLPWLSSDVRSFPSEPSNTPPRTPVQAQLLGIDTQRDVGRSVGPPVSASQVAKRARLAALLQVAGPGPASPSASESSRRALVWSPSAWFGGRRSFLASGTAKRSRHHRVNRDEDSLNHEDGHEAGHTNAAQRVRREMVSIGTQTDDAELAATAAGGVAWPRPAHHADSRQRREDPGSSSQPAADTQEAWNQSAMSHAVLADDVNAAVAEQYAAMFSGVQGGLLLSPFDNKATLAADSNHHGEPLAPIAELEQHREASLSLGKRPATVALPSSFPPTPDVPASLSPLSPTVGVTPGSALALPVDVIEFDELMMGRLLGQGSEGAVHAAWYRETPVAVKRFNRLEDSAHEVRMYLAAGSHDNVVAMRALCQHDGAMHLVLEYCPRGTLDTMLHHSAPGQWDPARLLPLVRSIARGMHHLHSRGIVHKDLKPGNIFVGAGQTMKVGDLGMAELIGPLGPEPRPDATPFGTVQYAAPETINEDLRPETMSETDLAFKTDVWSFGVTLWEILERRRPFEGLTEIGVQSLWLTHAYKARLPPIKMPEGVDPATSRTVRGLGELMEACTRIDPGARPGFGEVLRQLRGLAPRRRDTL